MSIPLRKGIRGGGWQNTLVRLPPGEVHVYTIPLRPVPDDLEPFLRVLDQEERRRAGRFLFDKDRHQLILSHHALRTILACYVGRLPEELQFDRAEHGKPSLRQDSGLRHNLSHSHRLAVLGICREAELGVDVEHVERPVEHLQLARRFFASAEAEGLGKVAPERRNEVFFTIWTRKEAYIKAIGEGLTHPLDRFCVWRPQGPEPRLTSPDGRAQGYTLVDLEVPEGYRASLAVEGKGWSIRQYGFTAKDFLPGGRT
ncbi:MAG: 4'-phosphopantetheinyl transferase superfamily protein [Armatimonadetes bacterium]|nr:4'-phosphopantetheinyl transferase superfamily protein [Armatimonadota bacterium]